MARSRWARTALLAGVVSLAATACTDPDRSASGRTGDDQAAPQRTAGVRTGGSAPSPTTGRAEPPTEPLVVVTHMSRRPFDVPEGVARGIIRGEVRTWAGLGAAPTPLRTVSAPATPAPDRLELDSVRAAVRAVVRDRDTVAVVPASGLGPEVRAVTVDGVSPVRRPGGYPVRTSMVGGASPPGPVLTITVTGDIMLGRGVAEAARGSGDPAPSLLPMRRRLAGADITVGNLEGTLSRAGQPTQGGDSFAADPAVTRSLRRAGFDVLGLANNHAGDFGDRALVRTVNRLRAGGIRTFGAGARPAEAWAPAVVERAGIRFGFLGFNAIGETPEVRRGQPGAVSVSMPPRTGPLDRAELGRFLAAVRRLDRDVDVVVVVPHWGTQYTHRPEPVQRRVAARLVAAGADLVVGGHPHWVQGVDVVDGTLVAHSLGNFVFDMDFMTETMEGVLLEVTFWGDRPMAGELVPYRLDSSFAPRIVSFARGAEILVGMRATSGAAYRG